jgi:hypothetical protein
MRRQVIRESIHNSKFQSVRFKPEIANRKS